MRLIILFYICNITNNDYNINIDTIVFKNSTILLGCSPDELLISQIGGLGEGVIVKDTFQIYSSITHVSKYSEILEIDIDLDSFYEKPFPDDFIESPRLNPKIIANFLYKIILKNNY